MKRATKMPAPLLLLVETIQQSLHNIIDEEFECPICKDLCEETSVNPDCGHRFCKGCIKESIRKCKKECPACRSHIPTFRTCRADPQFDRLVSLHDWSCYEQIQISRNVSPVPITKCYIYLARSFEGRVGRASSKVDC